MRGELPEEARLYRSRMLKIICSTGTKILERFLRLAHLPQCDWRISGELRIYIPAGIDVDEAKLIVQVINSVEFVLCSCAIVEYNKSKWNGHEAALDQIILHLALGGVGKEAYIRLGNWLRTRTKKSTSTAMGETDGFFG